jgi:hypothetical protein
MKFLYVSTDSQEIKKLIDPWNSKRYRYNNLDIKDGEELAKRIGFNPMSSITFDRNISYKTIEAIAVKLSNLGLFTVIDSPEKIQKVFPKDINSKNEIIKLALQEENSQIKYSKKAHYLFFYSNNPNQIRKD